MFFKQFIFKVIFVFSYSFCCSAVDASLLASFHNAARLYASNLVERIREQTYPAVNPCTSTVTGLARYNHWDNSVTGVIEVTNHLLL